MNRLLVPSPSPAYHGMQAHKACDVSGVFEVCGGGSPGCNAHLRVDSDNKGTGYAAGSPSSPAYHRMQAYKACDVSGVLEVCGGGGIHSCGYTAHPPG